MEDWISYSQASRRLGCSRALLRKMVAAGELTELRIRGGLPRLKKEEIEAILSASIRPRAATVPSPEVVG